MEDLANWRRIVHSVTISGVVGWLVFKGTFSRNKLYHAMSTQVISSITYLL